jgi:hypothetical protein
MTDRENQKKIAELLGWTLISVALTYDGLAGLPPGEPAGRTRIPDWTNDLTACVSDFGMNVQQIMDALDPRSFKKEKWEKTLTPERFAEILCSAFIAAHCAD